MAAQQFAPCMIAVSFLAFLTSYAFADQSTDEAGVMSLVVTGHGASQLVPHPDGDLLQAVAQALGSAKSEAFLASAAHEVPEVEGELRATLEALPRNAHGNLNAPAVRYALHRLFVRQHGWRVVGLDPAGELWNSSSPSKVVVLDLMPPAVRELVDYRLRRHGLRPREVAVLAATVEYLIHVEAVERLRAAYGMLRLPAHEPSDEEEAISAVDLYMASYILAKDITKTPRFQMLRLFGRVNEVYPSWPATQGFVREVAAAERPKATTAAPAWTVLEQFDAPAIPDVEVMSAQDLEAVKAHVEAKGYSGFSVWKGMAYLKASGRVSGKSDLNYMGNTSANVFYLRGAQAQSEELAVGKVRVGFADMARVVERLGDRYGRWQNGECRALKDQLMELEDRGTGRVPLSAFYGKALNGKWQFQESVAYLRELGAMDESNPSNPRIIIPNYLEGQNNCIGTSKYYAVCCISECEELLGQLERDLAAPEASPDAIADLVAAMPSATVPANRTLSTLLLHRLNTIAQNHDGQVPIYGRLFAQWMHHVYPRECPYPHLAGTTNPQSLDERISAGSSPTASDEEMKVHTTRPNAHRRDAPLEAAPWVYHEELYGIHEHPQTARPMGWVELHVAMAVVAGIMLLLGVSRFACLAARRSRAALVGASATTKLYPAPEGTVVV